jgi:DNA ligase-1
MSQEIEMNTKPARVNAAIEPSYWVTPKIVIEVFADEITRSPFHTAGLRQAKAKGETTGYALRFPRLVSFRSADKRPEDATTVKELIEMFNQQKKVKVS